MAPPFESRFRVRSYELDGLGHANHAVYLNWFEQARYDALEAGGFPPERLSERGWGVHVVRIEVDYRRECRLGEALRVRTGIEEFRKSSMTIRQELLVEASESGDDAGGSPESAAEARVVVVWVGPEGRPMRIPDEVRSALGGGASP